MDIYAPFRADRPILVGMVHLKPLPGSPRYRGSMAEVLDAAQTDAQALLKGHVDAIMVENFGDIPFYKNDLPPETVAAMAVAVSGVCTLAGKTPVGANALRNDGEAALAIAVATGASFIRVNVLCGARVTDQGLIEGKAATILRKRQTTAGDSLRIMADIDVKHSAPLAIRPLDEEVADTVHRGLADALIVSGGGTGLPTDPAKLALVRRAAPAHIPVLVGSGADPDTVAPLLAHANGLIVGTALKRDGRVDAPVDPDRVARMRDAISA